MVMTLKGIRRYLGFQTKSNQLREIRSALQLGLTITEAEHKDINLRYVRVSASQPHPTATWTWALVGKAGVVQLLAG
jgi:hypothetical protein